MIDDAYGGFADRYDLFSLGFDEPSAAVVDFFRKLFIDNNVHRVLDCACGTGNDLLLFHSLGCEVIGSDLSPAMLDRAQRKFAEQGVSIPLYNIDYRDLPQHFSKPFDAITCMSSSIAEVPNDDEALLAFRSMHAVLRDEGLVILTQGTTDKQWSDKPRFILALDTEEVSRLFVIDYTDNRNASYNIVDILHSKESSRLDFWRADQHILLRDDQERLLRAAGFKAVHFYGSYDFDTYDKEISNLLITVAHK